MNGEIQKEMNKRYKLLKGCDGTSSTDEKCQFLYRITPIVHE